MPKGSSSLDGKFKFNERSKRRSTHICELSRGSDSNLLKLQPTASLRSRMKRLFQKSIIVTGRHPATRFYLRSHAAIAFERKRHGRSSHWWIIHPCSMARLFWEIAMSLTYLYCFAVIPYMAAFYMLNTDSYHEEEAILVPAYFICIVDIILNFITGYVSSNGHEIFLDPGLVASHYARGYFIIDLVTSIPYSWILHNYRIVSDGDDSNFALLVIKLLPLLKVLRLETLHISLEQLMRLLSLSSIARLVTWLSILSALFCHWAACLSYGFPFVVMRATKSRVEDSETWFTYLPDISDPTINTFKLYMYSFYTGLTSFFAIDSTILNDEENQSRNSVADRIVTCVLVIFGVIYQVYLIVVILQLVESQKAPKTRYEQIMNDLRFYIEEKHVPTKLEKKLFNYYEYRFQGRYFKENVIIDSLADHLKDEIVMHNCRQLIDKVSLFWNLPNQMVASIITALKPAIYLSDDVIFKCEDEANSMFFIGKGTLAVITYGGKEICHLEDGAHFGESSLLYPGFKRPVTVIALEECELFRLELKDFKRLIPTNSELHQRMRKIVKKQISILMEIEEEEIRERGENQSEDSLKPNFILPENDPEKRQT